MTSPIAAAADLGCTAPRCSAKASLSRCRSCITAALSDVVRPPVPLVESHAQHQERLAREAEPLERLAPRRRPPRAPSSSRSARTRRCTSAPARTLSRCSATSLADSRSASVRSSLSGPVTAAQIEPSTSSPARTAIATRGRENPSCPSGSMKTGMSLRQQVAEDASVVEAPGVPLGHLATQDGLDAGRVGLVLTAGEGEHPGVAVLDGDRRVEERGDRVGDREQVAGRQTPERLRLDRADVALGQQGAEHLGQVTPRRPSAQAEHRHPARVGRLADVVVEQDRRAQHQPGGVLAAELAQQPRDLAGLLDAHAQHQGVPGQHRLVERIVDDDAADVAGPLGVAVRQFQQGRPEVVEDPAEAGARAGVHGVLHSPTVGTEAVSLLVGRQPDQWPISSA